ncbi:antibiotic biosynthesis monooxygenase [Bordetella genomosp. 1]|uniref:Antibiotic biosynthesis monooxygenase n=1 Tax=Bordetella genomosp. 1 TaxID=1395607 RepID=A0A261RV03_9BORD|nr:antibiotic biosynthesis monooxygenase [Bordetella genomosp. 1]OZI28884.1 antibiotic biosynthesis monooxygenase [Bordetella genomosp. 1]
MYSSTFTFAKGQFDADFHALDEAIAQAARAIPGYLGEEAWENTATGLVSNVYYWETREALQQLMQLPLHREAKQAQSRWLDGYHVVVARVLGSHGNARIAHPLARRDLPLQWDDDAA